MERWIVIYANRGHKAIGGDDKPPGAWYQSDAYTMHKLRRFNVQLGLLTQQRQRPPRRSHQRIAVVPAAAPLVNDE